MAKIDTATWRNMMDYLRQRYAPICRQWFEELEPVDLDAGLLKIHTNSSVQQKYLQRNCVQQFTEAAQAETGALVAVEFITEPAKKQVPVAVGAEAAVGGGESFGGGRGGQAQGLPVTGSYDEIVLSPDYTFSNFVTGPNNQLAYAASVAVANQPGTAYNPLFVHGGVGLGKTHLLQGICQKVLEDNPEAKICYLSCDTFMNHFLDCVQQGKMNDFRNHYRHVDVLVIDDIHFLANRDRTQEEFFHTFNSLYQSNKQIVLSSDSPPSEIPQLEERLVSRFGWGLVTHVSKPDYETRVAIIKAKASLRGIEIPDDAISYIATKVDSNARELEGAITTIQGHAALQNQPINLQLAQIALGEPDRGSAKSQITLQHIIDCVIEYYNVKLSDLQSKRRHKSITEPRQICMWLARKRTRFSLEEIGGYFGGRDHTTVMHSIRIVEERREKDPNYARQIDEIDHNIDQR